MRIGIDLGGTKIEGILLDDQGSEKARHKMATPAGDYAGTIQAITDLVAILEQLSNLKHNKTPVGIGIPGTVSPATSLIKNANSTCLIGQDMNRDLTKALKRPVRLANDANCFAVSEATDGAGAGANLVFGVILGTGVGGCLAIEGKAIKGINGITGEWGHNPLPWATDNERPGPQCYCGLKGCIETFLSGPSLAADYERESNKVCKASDLVKLGSHASKAALSRYENRLARALASIINILDPDIIVLGGGLSNISQLYESVPSLWEQWVFSDRVDTRLLKNIHGASSGVRGAAWLN
jgi:fructokinase